MDSTATNNKYNTESLLYLAFEMGNSQWKLGFTIGLGQAPRRRTISAGELPQLREEIDRAKRRDLSIFQIGLRSVERRLTNALPISIRLQPVYGCKL